MIHARSLAAHLRLTRSNIEAPRRSDDKTGSPLALRRRVSGRYIKENMNPDLDWTYPFMGTEGN
ncbi:hypothetical protein [Streptomyces sp. 11-1-2]|uniref:hypothetical protein n=1 Tax=unclassified Streptomyces TaxID=2593676 RepID=UPI000B8D9525|nr:hypothetical protein [Streptomyces sp. 11-1-2]ASQ99171.1 hypothetical protein CGL27_44730 [Streptomyces sp. 11-1-2]